ncbi:MAG TPA: cytochrome c [Candidatus Eisenbacteria bacterium]
MKKLLFGFVGFLVAVLVGALVVMYLGVYDVGTGNHDNAAMNWALDMAMTRSVARHARGVKAPNLSDPAMIERGLRHYRAMCVECHGAPGVAPGEIAKGLFPDAPDLSESASDWTPEQLYWIIKNGLKFTAMPAWGPTHGDRELWEMTAFVARLPHLAPSDYQAMVERAGAGMGEVGTPRQSK